MAATTLKKDQSMKVKIIKQTVVNKANAKVGSVHEVSQSVGNLLVHTKKAVVHKEEAKKEEKSKDPK